MVAIEPPPVETPPVEVPPVDTSGSGPSNVAQAPANPVPPITLTNPDGTTETLTLPQAIPPQGVPTKVTVPGAQGEGQTPSPWADWYTWIQDGFANTPPVPAAQLNMPAVITAFQVPLERMLQIVATHVNFLADFLSQLAQQQLEYDILSTDNASSLDAEVNRIRLGYGGTINAIVKLAIPSLQAQIINANHAAYQLALDALQAAKVWSTENIYMPLATAISQETQTRQTQVDRITRTDLPNLETSILAKLAPVAATAASALALAQKADQFVQQCGEPMCQTMGPNTDLGKLLKALSIAADIALIAELAGMTESDLAAFIKNVIGKLGGIVGDFESYFSSGSETLGELVLSATGSAL